MQKVCSVMAKVQLILFVNNINLYATYCKTVGNGMYASNKHCALVNKSVKEYKFSFFVPILFL